MLFISCCNLLFISEVSRQNEIRKTKPFEQREATVFVILHSLYDVSLRRNLAPSYTQEEKKKKKAKFHQGLGPIIHLCEGRLASRSSHSPPLITKLFTGLRGPCKDQAVNPCGLLEPSFLLSGQSFHPQLATRGPPIWNNWCRLHSFPPNQPKHPGAALEQSPGTSLQGRTTSLQLQNLQVLYAIALLRVKNKIKHGFITENQGDLRSAESDREAPPSRQGAWRSATFLSRST